jgi:anion-transporting  ArsA/GET3 family ATPase
MPRPPANPHALTLPRVIFVTGKGGTGKSTIAVALALALSRRHRVTLVEVDPRQATVRASAAIVDSSSNGANQLTLTQLKPRGELEAFVEGIVPIKMIARKMLQSRTFGFVTTALPGLEAFLMLDRLRRIAVAQPHDRIVVDAPATGAALEMLAVADGVREIAPFGTLHRLAEEVTEFLRRPDRFAVMLALRPEMLTLRETIAAAKSLRATGIACTTTILNGVTSALFAETELARLDQLPAHQELARLRHTQAEAAKYVQRELQRASLATVTLPTLYRATLGRAEFVSLADTLEAEFITR